MAMWSKRQAKERRATGGKKSFGTLEDCHESRDTYGLILGNGSPRVAPIRPSGVCRVLNLDFEWTALDVLWGGNGSLPLFIDQDVRANYPRLVEEGGTTRTQEFRDVDARCADELILAIHGYLRRGHRAR